MRYSGALSALLVTAALLCAMPGLARMPAETDRVQDALRPARLRTLTVWLMPGDVGDRKLLNQLCAEFEKQRSGARVFVRVVTADEFEGETAVLPDVALFQTGEIAAPETIFQPLSDQNAPSGMFAGTQRAVPLWFSPNVLSVPQSWLGSPQPSQAGSLLAAATPIPEEPGGVSSAREEIPWGMLIQKGAVSAPEGVGWQQLLHSCPANRQALLVNAVTGGPASVTPSPSPTPPEDWATTLPMSRSVTPTPMPAISTPARVETLARFLERRKNGENLTAFPLSPAVSDRARYAAICRDGEDARAFVRFLLSRREEATAHALIPAGISGSSPDPVIHQTLEAYQNAVLPNAFAHTRAEILQLCASAFARCEAPARTLLTLR